MERVGEYDLVRLIGEGGMGKVFEAEERLSKRRVAVKLLRPEMAQSEQARQLFRNEMGILAKLDHPNLVRMFACAEVEGRLLMALELLEGRTLRDVMSEGPLPWTEAIAISAQIAAGLQAAHTQEHAVVHRDLKPENVMLLRDGCVKIMDFGVAKVLQALRKNTTHSVGTLQYMSPEQIDAAEIDARSDLYCLGLVLYEMLSGRPPFESASPRELLNLQCTMPAPPLPDTVRRSLPRGVEQVLFQLLEKTKEQRPATAASVCEVLEPFVPAMAVRSGEPRSSKRTQTASVRSENREPSVTQASAQLITQPLEAALRNTESAPRASPPAGERPLPHVAAHDTIALVEQATAPREVSKRMAAAVMLSGVLLACVLTYIVRAQSRTDDADAFDGREPTSEIRP
jgi:serine/threonine-protein kinase